MHCARVRALSAESTHQHRDGRGAATRSAAVSAPTTQTVTSIQMNIFINYWKQLQERASRRADCGRWTVCPLPASVL